MKEQVEELFPAQNDNVSENHQVNTTEIASEQLEVIAVDENGKVDAISYDYNEYRSKLISLYKLTTLENSIISTFTVEDNICSHSVILREVTGTQVMKSMQKFQYDSNFVNAFFIPMIEDYNKENIIFNSTIEVIEENKANFIARTKSNDSLIIMGISIELANQLKDIVTRSDMLVNISDSKTIDEKGMSNSLIIILTLIAIGMCFFGIIIYYSI